MGVMVRRLLLTAIALSVAAAPPVVAGERASLSRLATPDIAPYRDILGKMAVSDWTEAKSRITALSERDPMRPYLLAELYLAKDSPRVELFDLLDILAKSPHLPQAEQLSRLAMKRGAQNLPERPQVRRLAWTGGSPRRAILNSIKGDPIADALTPQIIAMIKADNPAAGEALLSAQGVGLSSECLTELNQRLAWSYYITNDVVSARRLAARATSGGQGAFLAPAYWVSGLAAWRAQDWRSAATAFAMVAARTDDPDLRAAGYFWAARSYMAAGEPQQVSALLAAAARQEDSFYGLLARETLGLAPPRAPAEGGLTAADEGRLADLPNARIAATLAALGRPSDADEVLRHQASAGDARQFSALVHLAGALSLPRTQLWLGQHTPNGGAPANAFTRYPVPNWAPRSGWQVDKALVLAHTLQESAFRSDAVSPAGARGLMQVMPGTANLLASASGESIGASDLSDPAVNMDYGQRYLEKLSRSGATGGLLAKVIAAYNAGPGAVERWKAEVRDQGDPLLFIESVPYYETRAYVNVVLRNYWMYQLKEQGESPALKALAEGLWSRFPGKSGMLAVRIADRSINAD